MTEEIVIVGTCRNDAPHYCPNCGNSFTALRVASPEPATKERPRYQSNEYEIYEAMERYGGSFVQQLSRLFRLADKQNKRKLADAFEPYLHQYDDLARQALARQPEGKTKGGS